jgi:hypothetical protein
MKIIPSRLSGQHSNRFLQKTQLATIIGLLALFASVSQMHAVVGQFLQVQGTNLVLSWPSLGYEEYMVL